jgi:hypothetical protein
VEVVSEKRRHSFPFDNAQRGGVVAIPSLGAAGVHVFSRPQRGWFFRVVRASCKHGPSLVAVTSMSRLFVLRNDEKFLRHVKWALGASD